MLCYKLIIKGKNLNITYINYVKKKAQDLNLNGFIKKLKNSDIELIIEGAEHKVLEMIDLCHFGTSNTKVNNVEIEPLEYHNFENFILKY